MAGIRGMVVVSVVLVGAAWGCGGGLQECDPECGTGFHCVAGRCLPDPGTDGGGEADGGGETTGDTPEETLDARDDGLPGDTGETTDTLDVTDTEEALDDGTTDTGPCTAGEVRCADPAIEVCGDGGEWLATECPLGCVAAPEAHCGEFVPSNIGREPLGAGGGVFGPAGTTWPAGGADYVQFDTGTGEISAGRDETIRAAGEGLDADSGIAFQVIDQSGGAPPIGVFSVTEAEFPAGTTVWVVGPNAFALASDGAVNIAGMVNCKGFFEYSGGPMQPGPGGYGSSEGPGAGGDGVGSSTGSDDGGAGGAAFGGSGGTGTHDALSGPPGAVYGSEPLVPLWGGSGGGNGGDAPGWGGPGGGACEFVSLESIVVSAGGGVDAAGHGGQGGAARGGGGGGGSGGGLLFEAPVVTVAGTVTANGGGGGSGAASTSAAGQPGLRGLWSTERAAGGAGTGLGCAGGSGSGGDGLPGLDSACDGGDQDGGGGGGGAGRIRLNGRTVETSAATFSPSLASGGTTTAGLAVY